MLKRLAMSLDRLGFRPLVAKAANLAYPGHSFRVDEDGDWVHEQPECTIVSPVPHTSGYDYVRGWVTDNWLWQYKPQDGDIIVDLGTGVGEEAVIFAPLIGASGLMLAVEAHPVVYRCLRKTVATLTNVRPINVAVGAESGTAQIDDGSSFLTGSLFGSGVEVPMVTLDELTAELPRIDFLRTNIEGAERLMLGGMTETVLKIRNICISCHDFLGRPETRSRAEVIRFFEDHGFKLAYRADTSAPMCDYVYGVGGGKAGGGVRP